MFTTFPTNPRIIEADIHYIGTTINNCPTAQIFNLRRTSKYLRSVEAKNALIYIREHKGDFEICFRERKCLDPGNAPAEYIGNEYPTADVDHYAKFDNKEVLNEYIKLFTNYENEPNITPQLHLAMRYNETITIGGRIIPNFEKKITKFEF